ncbi:MAG: twin-arginine translocation signal domain-containing protein, partial [Caldithrix sp.]
MSSRRDFLKTLGVAIISSAGAPLLLNGCVGLATVRTQVDENQIKLNKTEIQALAVPNGILLVKTPQLPGPIILRNLPEVGIVAVSSICTHR